MFFLATHKTFYTFPKQATTMIKHSEALNEHVLLLKNALRVQVRILVSQFQNKDQGLIVLFIFLLGTSKNQTLQCPPPKKKHQPTKPPRKPHAISSQPTTLPPLQPGHRFGHLRGRRQELLGDAQLGGREPAGSVGFGVHLREPVGDRPGWNGSGLRS